MTVLALGPGFFFTDGSIVGLCLVLAPAGNHANGPSPPRDTSSQMIHA